AKSDFSGYHNFSKTLRQHNIYAREYHQELNKRKIWK
ncbi:MAG: endolytic transglycosylase MltG, partial [Butyricimonas virosa]|nr:endolytic transglycosylase MltG [Butyricimonas virosa]